MRRVLALAGHPLTGPGIRYGIAGIVVASVYLGVPVALNGGAGVPIEAAIPIAYVLAISLHFTLQRTFVWRHITEFALTTRGQLKRYGVMATVQYPTTAIATAVLPGLLHLPQRDTYVIVTLSMALVSFTFLRTLVFHGHDPRSQPVRSDSPADLEVAEEQLLERGGVSRQG